jgi:hypothetical protein
MRRLWRDPSLLILVVLAACVGLIVVLGGCPTAHGSLADCIAATCRVSAPDGSTGTGCAFELSGGRVYVLTNAHIVGNQRAVRCTFWHRGHESRALPGRVIARAAGGVDAAIVTIDVAAFGGVPPGIVPLAKRGYRLRIGQTITSVGCARGRWSTGWKGHAVGPANFVPAPEDGRSGSALFDARGERIVALVFGRAVDNSKGYAVTVDQIYRGFSGWADGAPRQTGCPPCQTQLLPYRRYNEQMRPAPQPQQPPNVQVYPTLPSPQYAPAPCPTVDLSQLERKLDRIAELIERDRSGDTPAPQAPVVVPPVSPAAAAAGAVAEVQSKQSQILDTLGKLVGDQDTLAERFETRLAKVKSELGADADTVTIGKAYLRDLAAEKAPDVGRAIGGGIGQLTGNALLAAALAAAGGMIGHGIKRRIDPKP